MERISLRSCRTDRILATLEVAEEGPTRRRGLLSRPSLSPGTGLLLRPCGSVHTFFMQFAIDVVFLDRRGCVLRVAEDIGPGRLVWGGLRAHAAIEVAAGDVRSWGLRLGQFLELQPLSGAD